VIEKDNIRDLFSRTLENHTSTVRPEVWNGLQAKMAAAGVTSAVGAKGISALAKWLIGSAAVSAAAVTTVVLVNRNDVPEAPTKQQQETTAPVASVEAPAQEEQSTIDWSKVDDNKLISKPADIQFQQPAETSLWTIPEQLAAVTQLPVNQHPQLEPGQTTSTAGKPGEQAATVTDTKPKASGQESATTQDTKPEIAEAKITKIPNFFSPNNDGDNDVFNIESQNLNDFTIVISDAKGMVWTSSDPNFKWDGTYMNSDSAPAGTYSVVIMARDGKGKLIREFKTLEIRR